jgi:2,4-dienoyl-CoA reductase-like NADH-dependent reductase (Old Yellow Enzyme family)
MGRISHPSFEADGRLPVAPSAIAPRIGLILTETGMQGYSRLAPWRQRKWREFHGPLIVANGFDRETAARAVAEGAADAAFGRLFLANPDLPDRFRLNAPLNKAHESTFYGGSDKGYTDCPALGVCEACLTA